MKRLDSVFDSQALFGLEQRLELLERANRRLKGLIVLFALIGAGPVLLAATSATSNQRVVRTEELILTKSGQDVATFTVNPLTLEINIGGKNVAKFFLSASTGGGSLRVSDPEGSPSVQLGANKLGGEIAVFRRETNSPAPELSGLARALPPPVVNIAASDFGGAVEIRSNNGKRAGWLKTIEAGGSLDISNQLGEYVGLFDATKQGVELFLGRVGKSSLALKSDLREKSELSISRGPDGREGYGYFSDTYVSVSSGSDSSSVSAHGGFEIKRNNKTLGALRTIHTMGDGKFLGNPASLILKGEDDQNAVWIYGLKSMDGGGQIRLSSGSQTTWRGP